MVAVAGSGCGGGCGSGMVIKGSKTNTTNSGGCGSGCGGGGCGTLFNASTAAGQGLPNKSAGCGSGWGGGGGCGSGMATEVYDIGTTSLTAGQCTKHAAAQALSDTCVRAGRAFMSFHQPVNVVVGSNGRQCYVGKKIST